MLTRRILLAAALLFGLGTGAACSDPTVAPPPDAGDADLGGGMVDLGPIDAASDVDGGDVTDGGDATDGGDVTDGGDATDGGGSTDAGGRPDGAACMPTVNNTSTIGDACTPDGVACATGYVCFGFSGVVVSYSCQIPCLDDCDCAGATACATVTDKAGSHQFCRVP